MKNTINYKKANVLFVFFLFTFVFSSLYFYLLEINYTLNQEQIYLYYKLNFIYLYILSLFFIYLSEYLQDQKISAIFIFYLVFGLFLVTNIIFDGFYNVIFGELTVFSRHTFSIETKIEIIKTLILAIVGLNIGYIAHMLLFSKNNALYLGAKYERIWKTKVFSSISLFVFLPCFLATLYQLYIKTVYALQNGYIALYTDSSVYATPGLINFLNTFTFPALIIFLLYSKNKKTKRILVVVYSGSLLLSMIGGARAEAMTQMLVLITYYGIIYRKKIKIIYIIIALVILTLFAQTISLSRNNDEINGKNNLLVDFLVQQGGSYSTIGYTIEHYDSFSEQYRRGILYAPLINAAKVNLRIDTEATSIEKAIDFTKTTSYAHGLSYMVNPQKYLSGHGLGSSYIAEVLLAYGQVGVIIVNIFVGIFIIGLQKKSKNRKIIFFLFLIILERIFFMPRGSLFAFVAEIIRPLVLYSGIYIVYFISKNKYENYFTE